MSSINWSEIAEEIAADLQEPLSPGKYTGQVLACEYKLSKTSEKWMFVVSVDVAGSHVLPLYIVVPDGTQKAGYPHMFLQRMLACGLEVTDLADHLGTDETCRRITCRAVWLDCQVKVEQWLGQPRNAISSVKRQFRVAA